MPLSIYIYICVYLFLILYIYIYVYIYIYIYIVFPIVLFLLCYMCFQTQTWIIKMSCFNVYVVFVLHVLIMFRHALFIKRMET